MMVTGCPRDVGADVPVRQGWGGGTPLLGRPTDEFVQAPSGRRLVPLPSLMEARP